MNGKIITGVSGGEFGIVGRVEARDAETGEIIWKRPVIEGHMGELNGKPSTMTGKVNETWPGDLWKYGGGATWLGGTYDAETNLLYFGTGNPARGTRPCAPATTSGRPRASRSTPTTARSCGASRPPRMTAGTSTA